MRRFGDLRVRPKLIILHNVFFLTLAAAIYFSLIPLVEERAQQALERETALVVELFSQGRDVPAVSGAENYDLETGSADHLEIPENARVWLDSNPGFAWRSPARSGVLYRRGPRDGEYSRLRIPDGSYEGLVEKARTNLFLVLGAVYLFAVAMLELVIMPRYVYQPIALTLAADRAVQEGDRASEMIATDRIPGDEVGDIMRSRNTTVSELRAHEEHLRKALEEKERLTEDLREKNRMLEAAKKNLEDQDRLASLGLLSASVAHELNTPLSVLRGSIEKLLETVSEPAARARLDRAQRMTGRLRVISAGLLGFARRGERPRSRVALKGLVEEAWSLVTIDERASSIEFSNRLSPEDVVMGDSDRLLQVFVNLLHNAVHAVSSSGTILVHAKCVEEGDTNWLVVAVDDSGTGIPADVLPNIFDAFVTSRLDSEGTGLGLTVAEGIVTQHGGSLSAANRRGGGARLEVKLPMAPMGARGGTMVRTE